MISVLVPWAPAAAESGPERDAIWRWNYRRLVDLFSRFDDAAEIVIGQPDDVGDPATFSRSLALNRAAAAARGDVFVIVDADTTSTERDFEAALALVRLGGWTLPLRYVRLGPIISAEWLSRSGYFPPPGWHHDIEEELLTANSGIVAMPRAAFELVGGFDERFTSWGGEDDMMRCALETLYAPPLRHGTAFHLWHPRPPEHSTESPGRPASFTLIKRYEAVLGDRDGMLALLAEGR